MKHQFQRVTTIHPEGEMTTDAIITVKTIIVVQIQARSKPLTDTPISVPNI